MIFRGALEQGGLRVQAPLIRVNSELTKEPEEEQNITRDLRADGVFPDCLWLKKEEEETVVLDESQKSICRKAEWKNTQKQVAEPPPDMQRLEKLWEPESESAFLHKRFHAVPKAFPGCPLFIRL